MTTELYRRQGNAKQDDAIEGALRRVVPAWLRGSKLTDPVEVTAGSVVRVAHNLGRSHRGWFPVRVVDGDPLIHELPSDDAAFLSSLSDTHLQLTVSSDSATVTFVVF